MTHTSQSHKISRDTSIFRWCFCDFKQAGAPHTITPAFLLHHKQETTGYECKNNRHQRASLIYNPSEHIQMGSRNLSSNLSQEIPGRKHRRVWMESGRSRDMILWENTLSVKQHMIFTWMFLLICTSPQRSLKVTWFLLHVCISISQHRHTCPKKQDKDQEEKYMC